MLNIAHVHLRTRGHEQLVVDSLSIAENGTLGFFGGCDSGKSRLAALVAGLTPSGIRGDVTLQGRAVPTLSPRERAETIAYVPTDPGLLFSGILPSLWGEFVIGQQFIGNKSSCDSQIRQIIDTFDLSHLLERDPFTLSGGEKIRAAIGLTLAKKARLLILDQIFDALDQKWALSLRECIKRAAPKAVLVETHTVPPSWSFDISHSLPSKNIDFDHQQKISFSPSLSPVLSAHAIRFSYKDSHFEFGPTDIEMRSGELVHLYGPNGSGKTSIARTLALLQMPQSGDIISVDCDGTRSSYLRKRQHHLWTKSVVYVPQDPDDQLYLATVEDELIQLAKSFKLSDSERRARHIANILGLEPFLNRSPLTLPRPLRKLVSVGTVLAATPPVLLLDEPTNSLDYPQKIRLLYSIAEYLAGGGSVGLICHDTTFLAMLGNVVNTTILKGTIVQLRHYNIGSNIL